MNIWKLALVGAACALSGMHASAQETYTLKFAVPVPATHFLAVHGSKVFMDRVVELSKGRIKFEYYPAQQLGPASGNLRLLQSGVVNIAELAYGYLSDRLPLGGVGELPNQELSSCEGTRIYHNLTRPGGFLEEKEFGPENMRVLMSFAMMPYRVLTSKKAVHTLKDLEGMKIRTLGGATDASMRALGAVSVRLSGSEIRESITRGTIDGALYVLLSANAFGLIDSIKYVVNGVNPGQAAALYAVQETKFKQLPSDLQKVLIQAGNETEESLCRYLDTADKELEQALVAKQAIQVNQLSAAEVARWNKLLDQVKKEWAKRLDDHGRAGSEALAAWDKEREKVRAAHK